MGTAKTKVLLGIDGLEVKEGGEPSLDESAIKGRSQKEKTPIAPLGTNNFRDDGNQNKSGSDSASESDEDIDPGGPESSEDEDSEEDEDEDEDEDEGTSEGERGHLSLDGAENQEHPQMTYEEEQRFLKHAERQLSLTLAASDANDRGSELCTFVLICSWHRLTIYSTDADACSVTRTAHICSSSVDAAAEHDQIPKPRSFGIHE